MQNVPSDSMKYGQCPWCFRGDALYVLNKTKIQAVCSLKCGFASFNAVKSEHRLKFYNFLKKVKNKIKKQEENILNQYDMTVNS